MGCYGSKSSETSASMQYSSTEPVPAYPENKNLKLEVLLQIPGCTVHLMDEGEALELAKGEFAIVRILDEDVPLATIVKVGQDLQWPLTKDEPVVKLDSFHYLFSLPMKDGNPLTLSYGVTFSGQYGSSLGSLDSYLKEHSCFSGAASTGDKHVDWKEYAPRIEDYNNVLAKAIAGGTGQIVKGIFICSNAYTSQVQKGGEIILTPAPAEKKGVTASNGYKSSGPPRRTGANKSLKRVRKLSKMTEKMSKAMLNMIGVASGTVMAPMVNSKTGKTILSTVPGEVLVASLNAVNKVLDAAEVAEKQVFSATSNSATRLMTNRFGERAGEATEDVLASAGHCVGTAWNIFKIRKAITPSSSATSGLLNNAAKYKSRN